MTETATQIITTLEYLFEKFGIAVNWTTDTIVPQIYELIDKYRAYVIATDLFWLIVLLCLIAVCAKKFIYEPLRDLHNKKEGLWTRISIIEWYGGTKEKKASTSVAADWAIPIALVLVVLALIILPFVVTELIRWVFVPEIAFLKVIQQFLI